MPVTVTYGKRAVKRKNSFSVDSEAPETSAAAVEQRDDADDIEPPLPPLKSTMQKKRRVDSMKPSPRKDKATMVPHADGSTEDEGLTLTHGTPKKKRTPSPSDSRPDSPTKPAYASTNKAFPLAGPSNQVQEPGTPTRPNSPTKLSKRMLGRSKTDTILENTVPVPSFVEKRTTTLPNLHFPEGPVPLSRPPSLSPSRTNSLLNIPSGPSGSTNSLVPLSAAPAHGGGSTTVSRTYAGKVRSYLADVPGVGDAPEDDTVRESYDTLRQRYGVDQPEDDLHDNIESQGSHDNNQPPSPSKSRASGKGGKLVSAIPQPSPSRRSRSSAQQSRPLPLPPGMMNPLKSITELRNRGESRRFLDEVAYLLDGMNKSQSPGLIKSSALEIMNKLCDNDFFRKAMAADVLIKVYTLFMEAGVGQGDKILDALFLFYLVLVSKDPDSLIELVRQSPEIAPGGVKGSNGKGKGKDEPGLLVDLLFSILAASCTQEDDPFILAAPQLDGTLKYTDAELKRAGIGKREKLTMNTLFSTIRNKSAVFPEASTIRTSLMVTHILQLLPPSLLAHRHLPGLLNSLKECLKPLQGWSDIRAFPMELELSIEQDVDFENIYSHLRLIDLYLLSQWGPDTLPERSHVDEYSADEAALTAAREDWLTDGLLHLAIRAEIAIQRDEDASDGAARCLESVLRALVTLTHGDEAWCKSIVLEHTRGLKFLMRITAKAGDALNERQQKGGSDDEDEDGQSLKATRTRALDRLCLSLALLTNLVQSLDTVKDLMRNTYLDPGCKLEKPSCLDACTCSRRNNSSALEILVQLYVRLAAEEEASDHAQKGVFEEEKMQREADASFLRCHLAVIFGLFMQGNKANQRALLELLSESASQPVTSSTNIRTTLNRLVDQARQFVAFFSVVVQQQSQGAEGEELIENSRKVDDREQEVAREVVRFLESLRDSAR